MVVCMKVSCTVTPFVVVLLIKKISDLSLLVGVHSLFLQVRVAFVTVL